MDSESFVINGPSTIVVNTTCVAVTVSPRHLVAYCVILSALYIVAIGILHSLWLCGCRLWKRWKASKRADDTSSTGGTGLPLTDLKSGSVAKGCLHLSTPLCSSSN